MSSLKTLLDAGVPLWHLKIGEYLVTEEPIMVSTVLGSCVSVTFFHEPSQLAAIFHAMLPSQQLHREASLKEPGKFVDTAIATILGEFSAHGVRTVQIQTKLFGGAFTIDPDRKTAIRNIVDVGAKNVEIARQLLESHGLAPLKENILGQRGRKIFFYTATGDVWLKYLSKTPIQDQALAYRRILGAAVNTLAPEAKDAKDLR